MQEYKSPIGNSSFIEDQGNRIFKKHKDIENEDYEDFVEDCNQCLFVTVYKAGVDWNEMGNYGAAEELFECVDTVGYSEFDGNPVYSYESCREGCDFNNHVFSCPNYELVSEYKENRIRDDIPISGTLCASAFNADRETELDFELIDEDVDIEYDNCRLPMTVSSNINVSIVRDSSFLSQIGNVSTGSLSMVDTTINSSISLYSNRKKPGFACRGKENLYVDSLTIFSLLDKMGVHSSSRVVINDVRFERDDVRNLTEKFVSMLERWSGYSIKVLPLSCLRSYYVAHYFESSRKDIIGSDAGVAPIGLSSVFEKLVKQYEIDKHRRLYEDISTYIYLHLKIIDLAVDVGILHLPARQLFVSSVLKNLMLDLGRADSYINNRRTGVYKYGGYTGFQRWCTGLYEFKGQSVVVSLPYDMSQNSYYFFLSRVKEKGFNRVFFLSPTTPYSQIHFRLMWEKSTRDVSSKSMKKQFKDYHVKYISFLMSLIMYFKMVEYQGCWLGYLFPPPFGSYVDWQVNLSN